MKPHVKFAAIGAVLILGAVLLFTEGNLIPRKLQPSALPLVFKEYRESSGPTAVFEMRNQSGAPVVVWEAAQLVSFTASGNIDQDILVPRTVIEDQKSAELIVPASADSEWQVSFRVSRFRPNDRRKFESGKQLTGTIVFSDRMSAPPRPAAALTPPPRP